MRGDLAVTRRTAALVVVLLAGCAQRGSPPAPAPPVVKPDGALAEAARLDKAANELYDRGKYRDATPLAERSLALRERARGADHPDVAVGLNTLARLYQAQGALARAEPLFVRALAIHGRTLDATDPVVADSLNNLGALYFAQGEYARAEPLLVRARDIRIQRLGATNPAVAESLSNLGSVYFAQGTYARAEPLLAQALAIREQALGAMHPDVAESVNNLAVIAEARGDYARAEPLYVRALAIREKILDPAHPAMAESLRNLGQFYANQGAYARAEPLMRRALDLQEQVLGATHPDLALSLNSLADLYQAQGAYARAEPLMRRALAIREKALGPMHPDVGTSLHSLATLYQAQGAYARAEPLYLRVVDIREKTVGAMSPDFAMGLANLGTCYLEQGAYERAEPLFFRALDIREKALGATHPYVGFDLNNLALLYHAKGAYAQAEQFMLRANEIWEHALGATHPYVGSGLHNLARLYQVQGAYARAEPLYLRAINIVEKAQGPRVPQVAVMLNALAGLYREQGAYARAEPLLRRALDIREHALDASHPDIAESLDSFAAFYQAQGDSARAEPLLARAAALRDARLRVELPRLSESRKLALTALLQGETERLVSLHAHALPTSAPALQLALTTVLGRKGAVLDSLTETQATLRAHLTPPLRDKLAELDDAATQLSTRLRAPFDPRAAEDQQAEIAALRARIDGLEAELNQASVEFRVQAAPVTIAKIQAALPRGSALVELVRYRRFDARSTVPERQWKEAHYLAYLLFERGDPQWVALGDAARIDAGVDRALAAMRKDQRASSAKAALRQLDALVFAPIRARLAGVSHVIVSPDGKLNLVPFEALVDPRGHYALEDRLLSYVTSGRDLLRLATRQPSRSPALILADPDYGPPGKSYVRADGTLAAIYPRLAGTLTEAQEIEGYLASGQVLTAAQATKAALTAAVGPTVLHVATHGFYPRAAAPASPPGRPADRGMSIAGTAPPPPAASRDPLDALDHTGLALAGANLGPDGLISAREIAARDWWGTQLVVLSACGTGVGEVASGEGIYGLRRALVLAGVQAHVVSLWNVNDASAPALMREFYAELARGTGRAEALRQAQLRILRQTRFANPYYWAAFIAAGDWTPLDQGTLR